MIRWILAGRGGTWCAYGCDLPEGTPVQLIGPANVVGPRVKRRCRAHAIPPVDDDAITTLLEARAIALEQAAAALEDVTTAPAVRERPRTPARVIPIRTPKPASAIAEAFDPKVAAAGDHD